MMPASPTSTAIAAMHLPHPLHSPMTLPGRRAGRVAVRATRGVLVAVLASAGALAAVHAADPPKKAGFGSAKGPLLTRDELRDCMARQERVRTQTEAAQKTRASLDADKAEIDRQEAALTSEQAALDRTSAEAVDAYNAKARANQQRIDAYESGVPAFNASVQALQADRDAFEKGCNNRRFMEEDEISLKKGK